MAGPEPCLEAVGQGVPTPCLMAGAAAQAAGHGGHLASAWTGRAEGRTQLGEGFGRRRGDRASAEGARPPGVGASDPGWPANAAFRGVPGPRVGAGSRWAQTGPCPPA